MTGSPRIVFSTFRSGADPMLRAWGRFRDSVAGDSRPAPVGPKVTGADRAEHPGVWRVLASNNRELARSAGWYDSFASAHEHAIGIRRAVNDLDILLVSGAEPATHGWYFTLDGCVVLTCGRWYGSSALGLESALAAIDALRVGQMAELPHEIRATRRSARIR
ncbi:MULTISPECIES: hypothetical protein [unclassified Leifsonia]|uniref:hypothetical protein n=1 Tax=unclassified Leifsonia TaxID=2663824 RepID=UPI0006F1E916|nr:MULTISPECIES: hypothetical protein [unclassified Leifsonia]KQX08273.1 hypothetical protein ASC59_11520 [Leifsonia sp. Root1293]KRA12555.1 hypothetical protein ASD61_11520 [Leifsonia sp. Root60]